MFPFCCNWCPFPHTTGLSKSYLTSKFSSRLQVGLFLAISLFSADFLRIRRGAVMNRQCIRVISDAGFEMGGKARMDLRWNREFLSVNLCLFSPAEFLFLFARHAMGFAHCSACGNLSKRQFDRPYKRGRLIFGLATRTNLSFYFRHVFQFLKVTST